MEISWLRLLITCIAVIVDLNVDVILESEDAWLIGLSILFSVLLLYVCGC